MIVSQIRRVFDKCTFQCAFRYFPPIYEVQNLEFKFSTAKLNLPDPPKKPLTAYLIFCKDTRPTLIKENPSLTIPQMVKVLAEKWSNLNPNVKKDYEEFAREGLILYSKAHKEYYETLTDEQKVLLAKMKEDRRTTLKKLRLRKALKESGLPSLPGTAYTIYLRSKAKDRKTAVHLPAFSKEVGEIWRNMTDDEKEVYANKAEIEKKEYESKMMKWRMKLIEAGQEDLIKGFEELKVRKRAVTKKSEIIGTKEKKIK